jgi:hypothetical protein
MDKLPSGVNEGWLRWRTRRKVRASEVAVTAQQTYDVLLRDLLSPGLRLLGLTGSAGRFQLRCEACWVLLGLQKSAYSDAAEVQFTVNLMVANKNSWATMRAEKPYLCQIARHPARSTAVPLPRRESERFCRMAQTSGGECMMERARWR